VQINGKLVAEDVIGDGIVAATPFGSTAYFHAITGKKFTKGIGIAFNNPTKKMRTIIAKDNSEIDVIVKRETGILAWDDSLKTIPIKEGDVIKIRKSAPAKVCLLKKA
jgi:NAD kinase